MNKHITRQSPNTIEEWRDIPGYEGRYQISSTGRVRSRLRSIGRGARIVEEWRLLTPAIHGTGYLRIGLSKNGRRINVCVHRLVLLAFIGEPPPGMQASHLNGDRTDNRLFNLAWESPSANSHRRIEHGTLAVGLRGGNTKLTEDQVREIRMLGSSLKQEEIGKLYGVSRSLVSAIQRGEIWRHLA